MIEHFGNALYALTFLLALFTLLRWHRRGLIDLSELFTATDRNGIKRTDGRKLFEVGAFFVSTASFYFLTISHQMSEWYALIYVGSWVTARSLRDVAKIRDKQTESGDASKNAG